ncbi:ATP-dependent zinc metalloprotease FtsH [Deinococcus rubellus]|uniref:ATP-dependent zinc metalloprotease FtsH n=1 Tax=Deinococcus rubellus TaxID=1889240 RepID=A0ABY5YKQ2_9DEIO|nr:ATP-dependent zinc metalloprotease FtsH [Deinococcus rubellus]UWX64839.1 ATP-dependent zinc metalloprotease FtsH [Deinococcus rubellus]
MKRVVWPLWLLGAALLLLAVISLTMPRPAQSPLSLDQFQGALAGGEIQNLTIQYQDNTAQLDGTLKNGTRFESRSLADDPLLNVESLQKRGVDVTIAQPGRFNWITALSTMLTVSLIVVLLITLLRSRNQQGSDPASQFGKSKAHVVQEGQIKVNFGDVAGCDEAKADLTEVVDFLKHPEKYHALGARIPHGILLVGPPGSGKTLLARAVAGEAKVPYFSISGSDFVEMFVGVGAARVRDLFEQARKAAPCIVFIDEIDAVGRKRGSGMQGGNDEREQTLNQLLVEMDGFGTTHEVIILAATNRPDVLDAALLRPGRFDRQVVVDAPDVKGRETILKIHARKKPLEPNVDLNAVARRTPGMVGADLENLLNEAALGAAREQRNRITNKDIDEARDRVLMGPERRSMVIGEKDRRVTAYHEVGHALAAQLLPHADRVHKLTVVPRGRALGAAMYTPEDRMHHTEASLLDRIAVALAGHAAEAVALGAVTTGAQSDFQQATNIARKMITEWGMSKLGNIALQQDGGYLGLPGERGLYSEETAERIDEELRRITGEQYDRVHVLLTEHVHQMHRLVDALIVHETLNAEQFAAVLAGGTLEDPTLGLPAVTELPAVGTLKPGGV